ncbi:MAG: HEAT repeat domain-containing protein [Planctomycetes bacterium]|nr:HEAT repeat domain-containing protein [Planctomycetota bacterium]MCC7170097.1 HEAT repeat domain-containing protein [Planctomycetota bacterium]
MRFSVVPVAVSIVLLCGCATDRGQLTDERKAQLEHWWKLYQSSDPGWQNARQAWFELGGEARETLVLSLLKNMVQLAPRQTLTARGNTEASWRRPQRELLELDGEVVVPALLTALRVSKDPPSQTAIVDTLGRSGSVDAMTEALDAPEAGDSPQFQPALLKALMTAGGDKAVDRVGVALLRHDDWRVRAGAAEALGQARNADRSKAAVLLKPGLEDSDAFVRKRAIEAYGSLRAVKAAPLLALALERAHAAGASDEVELCGSVLRELTGASVFANDPVLWQEAAQRAATKE